jgi:peptidoglycan/xylan/chitin deacetylase (PgdA/CDA1 family)
MNAHWKCKERNHDSRVTRPGLKQAVKAGLAQTAGRWKTLDDRRVIICYHSIGDDIAPMSRNEFTRHAAWLAENADVVPLATLRSQKSSLPRVALTFDDGFANNRDFVMPILLHYGLPATFFLTTGLIERKPSLLNRFAAMYNCNASEIRPLSWSQVAELRQAGFEIGAHTNDHVNLAQLTVGAAVQSLRECRAALESAIQEPIRSLAYPFGKPRRHVTEGTREAAWAAGFHKAVAIVTRGVRENDSDLCLPRIVADGDPVDVLAQKVRGAWDFVGWWQEHAPMVMLNALGPGELDTQ